MAGHSKWANIQHRKGRQDKKRSNLFTKLAREITVAAKIGDPNPEFNPRLRLAVQAAKKQSMPNDNIDRAIKAATGAESANLEEIRYEGYAPNSIAVIVECLTDNKNRTASEVRSIFSKNGGNMGETGSVSFNFERCGLIMYKKDTASDEAIFEAALEAGAEDVESSEEGHIIITSFEDLHNVSKALEEKFDEAEKVAPHWRPLNTIEVDNIRTEQLESFIEKLEDCDDVQNVYTNAEW